MNDLVRRYIKTAMLFLVLGLSLGLYMLFMREINGYWPGPYLISAHTHAVFVGFVMFMILGVALWLFPRPLDSDTRFNQSLISTVYWLLLVGTLLRFSGELLRAYQDIPMAGWFILFAGILQVTGFILYIWTMWYRIRPNARMLRMRETDENS